MPTVNAVMPTSPQIDERSTVNRFVSLAVNGLMPMFDQQQQLFCYRLKKTDQGMVREGLSERYTMMTLMGLHRLKQSGTTSMFDSERVVAKLIADLAWLDNVGDLGVLLWMCGVVCPEKLGHLERKLDIGSALRRYRGARQGATMELSWFLTGLSYFAAAYPEKSAQLEPIAMATYRILTENQGERGLFGHLSRTWSLAGLARGRIGCFADQVYPIYAMAQFSKFCGHEDAVRRALKCANRICEEQGPLGQWWWHYDSPTGHVAYGYPVFSVHQHAMGPMTLFKLGEVVNQNFDEFIYKGLKWINSNNELKFDMEDRSWNIIWRSIFCSRRSVARYVKSRFASESKAVPRERSEDLKILFECRPYELGWLLYAFANR